MHDQLLTWYDANARDLPWRTAGTTAWGVLVSEIMLQQTPVTRVAPAYRTWLARWPEPADLAAEPVSAAIRQWGRLGYPRRAVRLHAAARAIRDEHGGVVPDSVASLRALPGVGEYTAAAVAAFAFGRRVAVLDTNVRRVLSRVVDGQAQPRAHLTNLERSLAESLLPADAPTAARWSVAVMELGALVCSSTAPVCGACPLAGSCRWLTAGRPGPTVARRSQPFDGTDRQARGRIMAVLRESQTAVSTRGIASAWPDAAQRRRALESLLADGLVVRTQRGYRLPD
jgi:A/G-specific adenine glycosylase